MIIISLDFFITRAESGFKRAVSKTIDGRMLNHAKVRALLSLGTVICLVYLADL